MPEDSMIPVYHTFSCRIHCPGSWPLEREQVKKLTNFLLSALGCSPDTMEWSRKSHVGGKLALCNENLSESLYSHSSVKYCPWHYMLSWCYIFFAAHGQNTTKPGPCLGWGYSKEPQWPRFPFSHCLCHPVSFPFI